LRADFHKATPFHGIVHAMDRSTNNVIQLGIEFN
jgi:hypothetical protein